MTLSSHLAELSLRHRMLDVRIRKALQSPAVDEFEVGRLKREKLKLKDAIVRLQDNQTEH